MNGENKKVIKIQQLTRYLIFQYYCHRKKLESIGRLHDVEVINRTALGIAKEVAIRTNTFFAGGICNTNIMSLEGNAEAEIREMYEVSNNLIYYILLYLLRQLRKKVKKVISDQIMELQIPLMKDQRAI